jgi:glucose/mannose-6-phosphate isomerase
MLDKESLRLDSSDMLAKVGSLPDQLETGLALAGEAWEEIAGTESDALVIAGVGGSAIGGEILRSYLSCRMRIPMIICRDYRLPAFVNANSTVVISSYSGNTREALSCLGEALGRRAKVACISSGGELVTRVMKRSIPFVRIPSGYPPRAAVGFSFAALLSLAWHLGLSERASDDLHECIDILRELRGLYSVSDSAENTAVLIARGLVAYVPIIYCCNELKAVGLRWKNQFCENSKKPAFVGFLPEMSHNDIMGWEVKEGSMKAGVIFLRVPDEHPQVSARFPFLRDIVRKHGSFCGEYWGSGSSLISRLFSLILLGDYASVYLALLRGLDPTPIATIETLKSSIEGEHKEG